MKVKLVTLVLTKKKKSTNGRLGGGGVGGVAAVHFPQCLAGLWERKYAVCCRRQAGRHQLGTEAEMWVKRPLLFLISTLTKHSEALLPHADEELYYWWGAPEKSRVCL